MRRKDLEITGKENIEAVIKSCNHCRVAFADGKRPYILPLNYGYTWEGEYPIFYFHGAQEGRKVDLVRQTGYGALQLDTNVKLNTNEKASDFSMGYQSIFAEGEAKELTDFAEKLDALQCIMKSVSGRDDWDIAESTVKNTFVFKIVCNDISAKAHK